MFSLFKSKIDTSDLSLDGGVHITPEQRQENRLRTKSDEYLRAESAATDTMIAATNAAIDAECAERGITISENERGAIIDARIDARIEERDAIAVLASRMAIEQDIRDAKRERQMKDISDGLERVADEVHRSAVAANLVDAARAHPILTGFFGRLLYDKVTDK